MEPADVARSIRRRAAEVRHMGEYIGFWEWVVWSFLRDVPVHMLFGSTIVDVRRVFGPAAPAPKGGIHRVAAVQCSGGGYRSAAVQTNRGHVPIVNHFLVGTATNAVVNVEEATSLREIRGDKCAARAAMRVGWVLKHTTRAGDCGIDVMAYHAGLVRVPSTWQKIRADLAKFMLDVQDQKDWQDAFVACQDAPPQQSGQQVLTDSCETVGILLSRFEICECPGNRHLFW